eukprot:15437182-Alexandrium_andersonii.AAC.1
MIKSRRPAPLWGASSAQASSRDASCVFWPANFHTLQAWYRGSAPLGVDLCSPGCRSAPGCHGPRAA